VKKKGKKKKGKCNEVFSLPPLLKKKRKSFEVVYFGRGYGKGSSLFSYHKQKGKRGERVRGLKNKGCKDAPILLRKIRGKKKKKRGSFFSPEEKEREKREKKGRAFKSNYWKFVSALGKKKEEKVGALA